MLCGKQLRAWLAFGLLTLAVTSAAHGSCGDYLLHGPAVGMPWGGDLAAVYLPEDRPPAPCSAWGCGDQVPVPASEAITVTPSPEPERAALVVTFVVTRLPEPRVIGFVAAEPAFGFPPPIFHPPDVSPIVG